MALDTGKSSSVSQALDSRITVRDFLDKPVAPDILNRILTKSLRSASGGNLQPWKFHVLTGEALERFVTETYNNTLEGKADQIPSRFATYPKPLWEPQRSWRYKIGEDMYALLGIERDQKPKRLQWLANNSRFFNAPVGIIMTGNKGLGMAQYMDLGIILQSIMLLAREEGLHTAPQGWWRSWDDVCRKHLTIPEDEEIMVGLGLGYGNPDADVNNLRADRGEIGDFVSFYAK